MKLPIKAPIEAKAGNPNPKSKALKPQPLKSMPAGE